MCLCVHACMMLGCILLGFMPGSSRPGLSSFGVKLPRTEFASTKRPFLMYGCEYSYTNAHIYVYDIQSQSHRQSTIFDMKIMCILLCVSVCLCFVCATSSDALDSDYTSSAACCFSSSVRSSLFDERQDVR